MAEFLEVHVTVPDRDEAERIASVVVTQRLGSESALRELTPFSSLRLDEVCWSMGRRSVCRHG